ncbi:MAG: hypothetical protein ACLGG0_03045 [Bacteriovoracia bacterium]
MNFIKLVYILTLTLSFQVFGSSVAPFYLVTKLVTVEGEVIANNQVKKLVVEKAGFSDVEVTSVELVDGRVLVQNEIQTIEFTVAPSLNRPNIRRTIQDGKFDELLRQNVRLGPPNFDFSTELRDSGISSGGG